MNSLEILNPLNPHDALKHHITSLKTYLIFLQLRVKITTKLAYQYITIFINFATTSNHLHTSRELRQQFAACSG